jgi:carbon starvation protein
MFITTLTASWKLIVLFLDKASRAESAIAALNLRIDAGLLVLMAVLAIIVLVDIFYKWYGYLTKKRVVASSEIVEYSVD